MSTSYKELSAEALLENAFACLREKNYSQADEIFLFGMSKYSDYVDKYNDSIFRKEYVRYLVGVRRYGDAEAVVLQDTSNNPGWHHVIFARSFDSQGKKEDARLHWEACLKTAPTHSEAQVALLTEKIKTTPAMEPQGQALLSEHLERSQVFLEYGSGGSSVLASGVASLRKIYSVDSDQIFLSAVRKKIKTVRGSSDKYVPIYVNIGPTGDWGRPINASGAERWPNYMNQPWLVMEADSEAPDLILIDGRFRVACFMASVLLAPAGCTILFDDYFNRPFYHVAEKYLPAVRQAGRMAMFVVPEERPKGLVQELLKYCTTYS